MAEKPGKSQDIIALSIMPDLSGGIHGDWAPTIHPRGLRRDIIEPYQKQPLE